MTILEALKEVLRRHLPKSTVPADDLESWYGLYAHRILNSDVDDTHSFSMSRDKTALKDLQKTIRHASYAILELEHTTQRHLQSRLELFHKDAKEPLVDFLVKLAVTEKAIELLRGEPAYQNTPSSRPNWRAMSVAKCCRRVWAEEEWRARPEEYGPPPLNALFASTLDEVEKSDWRERQIAYEEHVGSFAPRRQHHTRPGPFGRFLEEVFEALGILAADGAPVSAATALDALLKQEHQEDG